MKKSVTQSVIDSIQRGPQQVIGYGNQFDDERQAAFVMGFNAAKEEVYRAMTEAGLWPIHDDPLDPDAGAEDSPCVESAARWGSDEGQFHGVM